MQIKEMQKTVQETTQNDNDWEKRFTISLQKRAKVGVTYKWSEMEFHRRTVIFDELMLKY